MTVKLEEAMGRFRQAVANITTYTTSVSNRRWQQKIAANGRAIITNTTGEHIVLLDGSARLTARGIDLQMVAGKEYFIRGGADIQIVTGDDGGSIEFWP